MAYLFPRKKTHVWFGWGVRTLLMGAASVSLGLGACGGKTGDPGGDGDVSTAGDGDGDTTTSTTGDGDGDTTTSSGDGDGDTGSTTTSGDGGSDSTTSGDGGGGASTSGDGDGDPTGGSSGDDFCTSHDDCVVAAQTDAPCYSAACSAPVVALRSELEADPCLVEWGDGETGPEPTFDCQFMGEIACPALCAQPPACKAAYCTAHGTCQLVTSQEPNGCVEPVGDATCDELEEMFDQALARASSCLAGGVVESHECDDALVVEDLCGCPHAVSSEHPIDMGDAISAQVAFNAQCEAPEICALLDCIVATESGSCEPTEHPDGVCRFN